jgi:uncharacterized protein (DUF1778 family)
MVARSAHLQIRIAPEDKRTLNRLARAAGQDLSSYVLSRALPDQQLRFEEVLAALARDRDHRFALAELNDFLTALAPVELPGAVAHAEVESLSPFLRNYVAAMVEEAAHASDVPPPAWTRQIAPLEEPHFVTPLMGLRLHLLKSSPVPFKRRNVFIDASLGARV